MPTYRVLYDATCPICTRSRGWLEQRTPPGVLHFDDARTCELPPGVTREAALAAMHVVTPEGRALAGADAVFCLLGQVRGWRWVARAPGLAWALRPAYRFVARRRMGLSRLFGGCDTACTRH